MPGIVNEQHRSFAYAGRRPPVNPGILQTFGQAPLGSSPLPALAGFPQGSAPTIPRVRATDGYIRPHNYLPDQYHHHPTNHFSANLANPQPGSTNTRSNETFFDGPRVVPPPSAGDFSDFNDVRHRRIPIRRPAHWEDNPYPASSLHDSFYYNAYGFPSGHRFSSSGLHHDYCFPERRFSGCADLWHHPPDPFQITNHAHQSCPHSCCPGFSGRHSTLTYVGPPTCQGCGHASPQQATKTTQNPVEYAPQTDDNEKKPQDPSEKKKKSRGGAVKRWLSEQLCPQSPTVNPKRPTLKIPGLRRVSPSSFDTTTAGGGTGTGTSSSRLHDSSLLSPTLETIAASTSENHHHLSPTTIARNHASSPIPNPQFPRPPSTISTCQCDPTNITLNRILHHQPFDQPLITWDITVPPSTIWGTDLDFEFQKELATVPPVRHLFINGIGDFPLERCQGDPDPSRRRIQNKSKSTTTTTPDGDGDKNEKRTTLPWPIRVTGNDESNGFITIGNVLRAIYNNFQEYIPAEEYDLYTIQRKRVITAAYHLRQKALEEKRSWPHGPMPLGYVRPVFMEDRIEDGIMRCDYLGSQVMFRGLEVSPDEEGYTLFLGPWN
ncbi:hypothetical protein AN958_02741 [Leucoagaricus sp. SymC.cos]|nr:hypothetical protein AN958_02741 [Leucoagaricus sp. SymC.cos]